MARLKQMATYLFAVGARGQHSEHTALCASLDILVGLSKPDACYPVLPGWAGGASLGQTRLRRGYTASNNRLAQQMKNVRLLPYDDQLKYY